jgi:hypothetical protein
MTESELNSALAGNIYSGDSTRSPGNTYIEYIQADGKISDLWNTTDRYKGEWVISGNVFCARYKKSTRCNTLSKSGDTIFWHQTDGSTMEGSKATVMKGDPKKLAR